jgi:tetratricopeptide (TPR) repeat protein
LAPLPLAGIASFGAAACGSSLKYIDFNVKEGNRDVIVRKYYDDGLRSANSSAPSERAYQAVVHGDIKEGIRLAKEAVEANPTSQWTHYDLGILYEANHDWAPARAEMVEAKRLQPDNSSFQSEIAFIDAHK